MNKCPSCGANLMPGHNSCVYCGHTLPAPVSSQPLSPPPSRGADEGGSSAAFAHFGASPGGPGGSPPPGPWTPPTRAGAPQLGAPPLWQPPSAPADAPNFILWIVLGIVQFLVCQGSIFAIIGTVIAFLANNEWSRGEYESARRKIRTAKILTFINIAFVTLLVVSYIGFLFWVETQ
jgi:hypothetical protein